MLFRSSAVHFLRFELAPAMIKALKAGARLSMGVDHAAYSVSIDSVAETTRSALFADLAG